MPCTSVFLTRNEQVSGSSPLVGSPFYLHIPQKRRVSDIRCGAFVSSTSAVGFNPKARQYRRRRAFPSRVSSVSSGRELPHVVRAAKAGKATAAALTDSAAQARLTVTVSASPRHGTRQPEPCCLRKLSRIPPRRPERARLGSRLVRPIRTASRNPGSGLHCPRSSGLIIPGHAPARPMPQVPPGSPPTPSKVLPYRAADPPQRNPQTHQRSSSDQVVPHRSLPRGSSLALCARGA